MCYYDKLFFAVYLPMPYNKNMIFCAGKGLCKAYPNKDCVHERVHKHSRSRVIASAPTGNAFIICLIALITQVIKADTFLGNVFCN